jgi:hypothetical protein
MTRQDALGTDQMSSAYDTGKPTAYQFCLRRNHVFAFHTPRDRHGRAVL